MPSGEGAVREDRALTTSRATHPRSDRATDGRSPEALRDVPPWQAAVTATEETDVRATIRTMVAVAVTASLLAACGAAEDEPAGTPEDPATVGDDTAAADGADDGGDVTEDLDVPADDRTEDLLDDGAGGDGAGEAVADLDEATEVAVADLAATTGVDPASIEVVTAEPVSWSDGALGCPQEGQMYTQAIVPGYRIVLAADGEEVAYHGADGRAPARCDDPQPPAQGDT